MLRIYGVSIMVALMATLSGCGVDPVRGPAGDDPGSVQAGDQAATSSDTADLASNPTDDAIVPRAGCSVVQFCNASGSDGTVCKQQGCTIQTAEVECRSEVKTVCGSPVATWIFVTSNGVRHPSTASCVLSNSCGGQAPAGCFCDSICSDLGDCCFDGAC